MGKAEELRKAVSTIKEYCDKRKCARGENCLFRDNSDTPYYCRLVCQPLYWQPKRLKTRKEVFLERFPNAECCDRGEPNTCVNKVFGTIEVGCCHKPIHCDECWDLPAPDEFQEELE